MDDEFEYGEEDGTAPCRKLQAVDLAVLGLHLVHGMARAFTATAGVALQCVAGHANYNTTREQFREEAALEIETILGDPDAS